MIHTFLLIVSVAGSIVSQDMHFRSIHVCNQYAHALVHGEHKKTHPDKPMVQAYCIPKLVDPTKVLIYDK